MRPVKWTGKWEFGMTQIKHISNLEIASFLLNSFHVTGNNIFYIYLKQIYLIYS
jgi:hypothetical protein